MEPFTANPDFLEHLGLRSSGATCLEIPSSPRYSPPSKKARDLPAKGKTFRSLFPGWVALFALPDPDLCPELRRTDSDKTTSFCTGIKNCP